MNILVCVKQVPDTTEIKINYETNTLIREGVPSIVNPFGAYALEIAVRLKEKHGGTVSVLCMGPDQAKAALTNMRSVGVMGDERTYDYAIALRAVTTTDFMTAESAQIPWEVIGKTTSRIVNEVKHINRVLYDCTGKPPATIEFE